jgi:UDPglucose--hexose-1-phosphate uridylyltransferase
MSEIRRDPINGRWVIMDTDHPNQPQDYEYEHNSYKGGACPFCYGNESMTPPEIEVIRDPSTAPNTSGWQVRVVANKFPALQIEGDLERKGLGIYDMSNGVGAHEVILETPYHEKDIPDLLNSEVENFLSIYCRRAFDLVKDKRFKYIMVFKNFGLAAGASLEHPHTQMIALPMIPKSALEEIKGAHDYYEYRERCIFCDIIRQESEEKERIVLENKYFLSFCPYASRFPFEIWIIPKKHKEFFCQTAQDEVPALAQILRETIAKLKVIFPQVAYNFILHSSPVNTDIETLGYHWHIEFMPKLTRVAGFEWGSGIYLVSTPPELAAQYLREAKAELISRPAV